MSVKKRRIVQAASALGFNAYLPAWFRAGIYQGDIKGVCLPVLNCYSCPSAMGACPIGSLQNFFAGLRFNLSIAQFQVGLYILGVLGIVGGLVGRWPCGWLCPFGLVQDLLYKIPSPKIRIPKLLTYLKYVVLAVMVTALPLLVMDAYGFGQTWFCEWICPAGTLEAGLPLVALNPEIRSQVGFLFAWKVGILILFLGAMVFTQRPFCRTTCPLGALLGLFNKVSFFRLHVDLETCLDCAACRESCPVGINPVEQPNSPECLRCLKCRDACPHGSIDYEFLAPKPIAGRSREQEEG